MTLVVEGREEVSRKGPRYLADLGLQIIFIPSDSALDSDFSGPQTLGPALPVPRHNVIKCAARPATKCRTLDR